jgi:hypothetical protein
LKANKHLQMDKISKVIVSLTPDKGWKIKAEEYACVEKDKTILVTIPLGMGEIREKHLKKRDLNIAETNINEFKVDMLLFRVWCKPEDVARQVGLIKDRISVQVQKNHETAIKMYSWL